MGRFCTGWTGLLIVATVLVLDSEVGGVRAQEVEELRGHHALKNWLATHTPAFVFQDNGMHYEAVLQNARSVRGHLTLRTSMAMYTFPLAVLSTGEDHIAPYYYDRDVRQLRWTRVRRFIYQDERFVPARVPFEDQKVHLLADFSQGQKWMRTHAPAFLFHDTGETWDPLLRQTAEELRQRIGHKVYVAVVKIPTAVYYRNEKHLVPYQHQVEPAQIRSFVYHHEMDW